MIHRLLILSSVFALCSTLLSAQVERDQDLITLKNGYQYLGYVIEQQPGKLIKLYRAQENDTIAIALSDVAKLSKIWVKPFSEKMVEEEDRDSIIEIGRFNNKKNVFQVGYVMQFRDIEGRERRGASIGWQRNIKNRFLIGGNILIFGRQNPETRYAAYTAEEQRHDVLQYHFLVSSSFRFSAKPQTRRLSTWLNVNAGYIADLSSSSYTSNSAPLEVQYEEAKDTWTLQTGVAFRLNPDTQSGFALEPGFCLYAQTRELYAAVPVGSPGIFVGTRRETLSMFTLKLSYFF